MNTKEIATSCLIVGEVFTLPKDHVLKDENGNVINATKIVLEKKKKEYPKTYEECLKILNFDDDAYTCISAPLSPLPQLIICRDAYCKIAGEEMGLGIPWNRFKAKVGYGIFNWKGKIHRSRTTQCILTFPTVEMRESFYENFKELIEKCKELL